MSTPTPPALVGIGSPLVDLVLNVEEKFLDKRAGGGKGGMQLLDAPQLDDLLAAFGRPPERSPGGAAANTTVGAASLGLDTAFVGTVGKDGMGTFFQESLTVRGCRSWLVEDEHLPTGRVCCLITPDGERTMRTCLGAAMALRADAVDTARLNGVQVVMLEGYTLYNHDLVRSLTATAKAAGCQVALDLASFEVVEANRGVLSELLDGRIDLVFANEREAQAWHSGGINAALDDLGHRARLAVVKVGAEGAWVFADGHRHHVPAEPVTQVVDTVGAGDNWAAGFLAGWLRHLDPLLCARLGALAGAATVQTRGAQLPPETWLRLRGWLEAWR